MLVFGGGDAPYSLEGNLVKQLDLILFGAKHLYQGFGIPFDPEGVLSSLPAIVSVTSGYLIAPYLKIDPQKTVKNISYLLGIGTILLIIGWAWGYIFPINKALWTSSYVLYTSGIATLCLTLTWWLIDLKNYRFGTTFFLVFGVNSLFAYILSIAWVKILFVLPYGEVNAYQGIYENWFVPIAGNLNGSLLFALSHALFFAGILWILYRRKIFIKV